MINDFITGIQQRAQGEVDGLTNAHGDQHFFFRNVVNMEKLAHILGDRFAQGEQAEVRGVAGLTFFQRINRRLTDVPWGSEIRLAHA